MHERAHREDVSSRFFAGTAHTYDRVVRWGTYGLDDYWKRRLMAHVPTDATRILDLACGTGIVLEHLRARAPHAALVGVDYTAEYLAHAMQRFEGDPLDLTLLHSNAETVQLHGEFDAVVSSYLPKYVDASHLFERFHEHVRPGATVAFHDFGHPHGVSRVLWKLHMRALKVFSRHVLPSWRACLDQDLESLIRQSRWQDSYEATFKRFGYRDVRVEKLSYRTAYIVSARRVAGSVVRSTYP